MNMYAQKKPEGERPFRLSHWSLGGWHFGFSFGGIDARPLVPQVRPSLRFSIYLGKWIIELNYFPLSRERWSQIWEAVRRNSSTRAST